MYGQQASDLKFQGPSSGGIDVSMMLLYNLNFLKGIKEVSSKRTLQSTEIVRISPHRK